ncbi:MAG: DUF1963 domain-containing protein [Alphaproteobacteria bacterium]
MPPPTPLRKFFIDLRNFVFPFSLERWIKQNSRPAIYISKSFPQPGSLSFFGGSPIAPHDFVWPVDESLGLAKPFLAQIHLADLPKPLPVGMPRKGILYFFLDLAMLEGGESGGNVIYKEDMRELRMVQPSLPVPALGDEPTSLHGGWTFRWQSAPWQPFAMDRFPKFDLAFLPFRDIPSPEYSSRIPDGLYEKIDELIEKSIESALRACFGPEDSARRVRQDYTDYEFSVLFEAEHLMYPRAEKFGGLSPLYAQWPHAWGTVGLYLADFFRRDRYSSEPPPLPVYDKFLAECQKWIDQAKREGFYTALTPEQRQAFRDWAREQHCQHRLAWRADMYSEEGKAHQKIYMGLENNFHHAAQDAIAYYLASGQRDDLLDKAAQDDFLAQMEPSRPHQMFGYGVDYQYNAERTKGKLLLLQLNTDYPMMWMFADCGNLQFWIDPNDLAARRFDKVTVTIAGG